MQVTELHQFFEWFNQNINKKKLSEKYLAFYNKLEINSRQNQTAQSFQEEKDKLFETLESINFQKLTLEQIKFLKKLEIDDLLGNIGVQKINDVLYESNIDIATSSQRIHEFTEKINNAISKVEKLETAITENFETDEEEDEIPHDSVLMRVYFQNDVSIDNLTDFKKLSAMWYDIGRGIAMAQNMSPEDFNIIGAKKGSIIIEMVVAVGLATTVSKILLEALKVADRYLDILKKVQEVKGLKLANKQIEADLKKEAQLEKENGIKSILDVAVKDLKLNANQQGDKISAIEKSIVKLIDFTKSGGEVDFVQPNEDGDDDNNVLKEVKKLKENISEIRLLENKIKLLENKINGGEN